MGVKKHRNQIYVTDLGLVVTGRHDAQVKANTGRARKSHLIGTARFASINDRLGVGKYDVIISVCTTTDHHSSTTSLR